MTPRSVRILGPAAGDLAEIATYLSREAPRSRTRMLTLLLDAIESLSLLLERGALPRDRTLRTAGYRCLVVRPYLIFYKVRPRQVRVFRVLHAKRHYRPLLATTRGSR